MRKTLLVATILAAGALSLTSANAAPVVNLAGQAFTSSSDVLTVRQSGEAPRREDRRNDRRTTDATLQGFNADYVLTVRQAGEAPRREDRRNDRRTTEATPDGFDASQVLLVREAGSGAGRQRQRHTGNP